MGQIFAGLSIRPRPTRELEDRSVSQPRALPEDDATTKVSAPNDVASVTERTTNLLEHNY
jgi:hypothetical protein